MVMGQRQHLSFSDVRRLNAMYPCPEASTTPSTTSSTTPSTTSSTTTSSTTTGCRWTLGWAMPLPHPTNCGKFCHDGQEIACPSGLHFNAATQRCDWPFNVDCQRQAPAGVAFH